MDSRTIKKKGDENSCFNRTCNAIRELVDSESVINTPVITPAILELIAVNLAEIADHLGRIASNETN